MPEGLPELFARHYFAGLLEKHGQDGGGLLLNANRRSVSPQLQSPQVELELPKTARDTSLTKARRGHRQQGSLEYSKERSIRKEFHRNGISV